MLQYCCRDVPFVPEGGGEERGLGRGKKLQGYFDLRNVWLVRFLIIVLEINFVNSCCAW